MADMIKFYKGLEASLPASGVNGALYITTDEGAIYLGTGTGMKRLGDFVQVANVASLPTKAHESCLYYCVAENILAKWNGSEWKQINKQPTAEELKGLLGLGSLAYKSEVVEGDLNSDLAAKINAASGAQHTHTFVESELNKIADGDVAKWNAAEKNAKDHADSLNTAMNTRVEALEAIDHEHANKALLDTYTQTEANLADAVAKKHAHTFNETELNKIVDGDVAKWNGVAADHLTADDKAALENSIKEAKKAGTDANTNIETYKVANDARVLAVEEDVAEIIDGTNGILAQAKAYSDGKLATARTEISSEIDADVKVVADDLAGYKTSNDTALAGVKATAEAAATKVYTDTELAKKVDKVEGKSLVSDTEIAKLAGVSEGANKVEASENNGKIKIDGVETTVYTHPEKHAIAEVDGLGEALAGFQVKGDYAADDHKHVKADITDFAHTHVASDITDLDATIKGYDYATKTELGNVDKKFENYTTTTAQQAIDAEQDRRLGVIEGDYLKAADIANFETKANVKKVADDLAAYVESNDAALAAETQARTDADAGFETRIAALEDNFGDGEGTVEAQIAAAVAVEKERAEGIESGLRTDVNAIAADYLKAADKTELEGKITAEENRAKGVEENLQTQINTIMNNPDAEGAINSINEFTQYVKDHGTIADGFRTDIDKNKEDIAANAKAIEDEASRADEAEKDLAGRLDVLEAIDHDAYKAADTDLHTTISKEIDDDVAAAIAAEVTRSDAKAKELADAAQSAADAKAAELDAALKTELQGEIDADVKVVSDALEGYKTSNDAAVALKANAADVYAKSETFTKEEVAAAIAAAVTEAHTWGSF